MHEAEACDADSDGCTVDDACSAGVCTPGDTPTCDEADDACNEGVCESTGANTYVCGKDPAPHEGDTCDDGNPLTGPDSCSNGVCLGANCTCSGVSFCCDGCQPLHEAEACDADSDGCTVDDACSAGVCTPGDTPTCDEADDACNEGVCESTGANTYVCGKDPAPHEGDTCDDGNPLTGPDSCSNGVCLGADCTCSGVSFCCDGCQPLHEAEACDADSDGCTVDDACSAGVCTPGDTPTCDEADDACNEGVCESTGANTYVCGKDPAPHEGDTCDDGNPLTGPDSCSNGVCLGADCTCSGVSFCCDGCQPLHEAEACDADSDGCTVDDACSAGVCTPGDTPTCDEADDACNEGVCESTGANTYVCGKDPAPHEGDTCDDGNPLTGPDSCSNGVCLGADCTCSGVSFCCDGCQPLHEAEACDADSDGCTVDDACSAGVCTPGDTPTCDEADDACNEGVCESTGANTYVCGKDPAPHEGDTCDDGNPLTGPDSCSNGVCLGADCTCSGVSFCCDGCQPLHEAEACDADSDGCTVDDACSAGVCTPGDTPTCDEADDACNEGVCESTGANTYVCGKDPAPHEGDTCDDGNPLTGPDSCSNGVCLGADCTCSGVSFCCDGCQPLHEAEACDADSDGCTVDDACSAGVCTPGDTPTCDEADDACNEGVCESTGANTYVCGKDPAPHEGDTCDDGNPLTGPDSCSNGVCLGADCTCSGVSFCCDGCQPLHEAEACDADSDGCTVDDACSAGVCTPGDTPTCDEADDACNEGVCESTGANTYVCGKDPAPHEGDTCDDGNPLTGPDSCSNGVCLGADCTCSGVSFCCDGCQPLHEAEACDADSDGCTVDDACSAGVCTPGDTPTCDEADDACNEGVCESTGANTYVCGKDPAPHEGDTCDDGNPLTGPDSCSNGVCLGADCTCSGVSFCCDGCQPLHEAEACDADSDGCTVDDACSAGVCTPGDTPTCDEADDACNEGVCESTGANTYVCGKDPAPHEGDTCDDGNPLTGPDSCSNGVCLGADCTCSGVSFCCDGCQPLHEAEACDADSDGCTVDDACSAGVCTPGDTPTCDEADDACNEGVCESTGANTYVCGKDPAPHEGDTCDDGNPLTGPDSCSNGVCLGADCTCSGVSFCCDGCQPLHEAEACDADSDGCTVDDACSAGVCTPGDTPTCDEADDACNEGVCESTGANTYVCGKDPAPHEGDTCDDGNPLTGPDSCSNGVCLGADCTCSGVSFCCDGCQPLHEAEACDADSDGCTVDDACSAGVCTPGDTPTCDEADDACNEGVCESTGANTYVCGKDPAPHEGDTCDDGNPLTGPDSCSNGVCLGADCTCSGVSFCCDGCQPLHEAEACDADSDGCTVDDACSAGVCTPGDTPTCDEADDACNEGVCESTGANTYVCGKDPAPHEGDTCDDGNPLTGPDSCSNGVCLGADCTCSGVSFCCDGCQPLHEAEACDADSDGCTVDDACSAGVCTPGDTPTCDEADDACNEGVCESTGANTYVCGKDPAPHEGDTCDDGNACSTLDACSSGICTGVEFVECTQPEAECRVSLCDPANGDCFEQNAEDGAECNDGLFCVVNEQCVEGECIGEPKDCADDNECTVDSCDPQNGSCSHEADNALCTNENPCTEGFCDPTEGCAYQKLFDWTSCSDGSTSAYCLDGVCEEVPSNDLCEGAIDIVSDETLEAEFMDYHAYAPIEPPCYTPPREVRDAFYRVTLNTGMNYRLSLTPLSENLDVAFAILGGCTAQDSCMLVVDNAQAGQAENISESLLSLSGDAIIQVFSPTGSEGRFELALQEGIFLSPEGGTYVMEGGVMLVVPRGAVESETPISVEEVTDLDVSAWNPVSTVWRFSPAGLEFNQPVKVMIPYDDDESLGKAVGFFWSVFGDETTLEELNVELETVNGTHYASANVTHFSIGLVGADEIEADGDEEEAWEEETDLDDEPDADLDEVEMEEEEWDSDPDVQEITDFNLDFEIELDEQEKMPEYVDDGASLCQESAPGAGWWLFLVLAVLGLRKRRRFLRLA